MKKRKWQTIFLTGINLIFVIGFLGCADLVPSQITRERPPEERQPIATSYRFDDIPLPSGMTLNRKESFIYETGATRTGLLVYEGKGEVGQLATFFKQQMPNHQWRLLSNFELHNVMLSFIKEGWSSVIYIYPQDSETKRVEIRVGPVDLRFLPPARN